MKSHYEITRMIDSLMFEELTKAQSNNDRELEEKICNQIDALLWVIGDRSGAPLVGEER